MDVRPKKALGQHFLTDQAIARAIVDSLSPAPRILEVGPGMGVLTQYLLQRRSAPSRSEAPAGGTKTGKSSARPESSPRSGASAGHPSASGVLLRSDKKILATQAPLGSSGQPAASAPAATGCDLRSDEKVLAAVTSPSPAALKVVEIDGESVQYLLAHYPALGPGLLEADFLKLPLDKVFAEPFSVIGNFPYNISSQIFFHILDYRDLVPEVVCMIQKEVAERLAAGPGSKTYGILSVLLQMWYDIEYRFTVGEGAFVPPPKVKSAVIRLTRNARTDAGCDESLLRRIVKATFNQRRKTIRNGLRSIGIFAASSPEAAGSDSTSEPALPFLDARPEQLSVEDFITLTRAVEAAGK